MRFNEEKNIQEALEYIKGTYGEHYANNDKHQLMDDIIESGEDLGFNRWNAMKYLKRYGKKSGFNRKDLLKAIHYSVLLLYHNDRLNLNQTKVIDGSYTLPIQNIKVGSE